MSAKVPIALAICCSDGGVETSSFATGAGPGLAFVGTASFCRTACSMARLARSCVSGGSEWPDILNLSQRTPVPPFSVELMEEDVGSIPDDSWFASKAELASPCTGIRESKVHHDAQHLAAERRKLCREVGAITEERASRTRRRTIATLPSDEVGDAALLRKQNQIQQAAADFGCRYCHFAMSFADTVMGVPKGVKSPSE